MNESQKEVALGDVVTYCDPYDRDRIALVTAVWSETCINVVFVSADDSKTDSYGRQIERATSVTHASIHGAPGNYWRRRDEDRISRTPPAAA